MLLPGVCRSSGAGEVCVSETGRLPVLLHGVCGSSGAGERGVCVCVCEREREWEGWG